ncbi:MAG: PilN domain-containing protein [Verrucomicrobia bacterium]|nr:PilN domain-containing protein [Verrucomicrobiota bacterium]
MSFASATLLLPSPDTSWRVWKSRSAVQGEPVEHPTEVKSQGKPLVIGLPAAACRTIGLVLPNADHAVLEQIIITQLERRGLKLQGGEERNFRWHLLTQTATTATVSVDVLADPFPEDLALTQITDYTAALRLLTLPAGHLVVTEESGSTVMAVGYQGKLYHSHIFATASVSGGEIAHEIMLAQLTLDGELGQGFITGATLVGASWDRAVGEELGSMTGLPVKVVPQLPPNADLDAKNWPRLLPASVRNAQNRAVSRGRLVRFGLLGGMLVVALVFLAFAYLTYLERTAAQLTADVDATAAPAAQVRKTAEQWKALAPAIEPKRYAMVILNEVTKLMPPSGIVIRDFEVKDNEIDIRGDARDTQTAVQFVEDLQKHPILSRYTWTKPQPTVKDKTAQFRAQGKAQ